MKKYLGWVSQSRLLAPNLKELTLHVYSNTQVPNRIARYASLAPPPPPCVGSWRSHGDHVTL